MKTRNSLKLDVQPADGSEPVPAVLLLPRAARPVPGVLLLHGFNSSKEEMSDAVGAALARHGTASLAIDLPFHGTQRRAVEGLSLKNPMALIRVWRRAVYEAHQSLAWFAKRPEVDPTRLAIAGYSVGAYLAIVVASENRLVRVVALAAGGDLPETTPFAGLVRTIADPRRAARSLKGRPLLMINGRRDRTIRPAQAEALFAAAREPKELRWYNGGHQPPQAAIEQAAGWVADRLAELADVGPGSAGREAKARRASTSPSHAARGRARHVDHRRQPPRRTSMGSTRAARRAGR